MNITQTPNQILDEIAVNVRTILTGGNVVRPSGIQLVRLDTQFAYRLEVTDVDGTLVQPERIVPGRVRIVRHRPVNQNWDMVGEVDEHYLSIDGGIIPGDPSNPYDSRVEPGNITQAYTFWSTPTPERPELDGWKVGDEFAVIWSGVKVLDEDDPEVVVTEFAPTWYSGSVTDLAGIDTDVQMIRLHVESPTYGLEALKAAIDAIDLEALDETDLIPLSNKLDEIIAKLTDEGYGLAQIIGAADAATLMAQEARNYADILDDATNGLNALRLRILERATPADVLAQMNLPVNGLNPPTAKSLRDILSKDTSYSYDKSTDSLEAISDKITVVDTQTDILAHGTNGNAAIRTRVDAANTALDRLALRAGTVLLDNPGLDAVTTGWSTSAPYSIARETDTYRSSPACLKLTCINGTNANQGCASTLANRAKIYGRYYGSVWVRSATAGLQVFLAAWSYPGNTAQRLFGSPVTLAANTWTRIEGIATLDNAADAGSLVIGVRCVSAALNDVIYFDDLLVVELDDVYDDFNLRHTQSKNDSLTFDRATDSLEAIRDLLDTFNAPHVGRSADSGSTLMDGTEKILYEESGTTPWEFKGGWIDLTALADTRSVTVKIYVKIKSGDSYIEVSSVSFTGAADAKVYPIPSSFPIGGTSYQCNLPHFWNVYGVKVTAQQTVLGSGYVTIDSEFYDTRSA